MVPRSKPRPGVLLAGACQTGTAWGGSRRNPFIRELARQKTRGCAQRTETRTAQFRSLVNCRTSFSTSPRAASLRRISKSDTNATDAITAAAGASGLLAQRQHSFHVCTPLSASVSFRKQRTSRRAGRTGTWRRRRDAVRGSIGATRAAAECFEPERCPAARGGTACRRRHGEKKRRRRISARRRPLLGSEARTRRRERGEVCVRACGCAESRCSRGSAAAVER